MNNASLNDIAWEQLFDKYSILTQIERYGLFQISAEQIKEFREPRLMAKFDHTRNLPKVFFENQLSILPITRGDYVISHFDAYHIFESDNLPVVKASIPSHIQSLDSSNIQSEAIALNCALASGIIADFMEDNGIVATVSGRMGSGDFSFIINDVKTDVFRRIVVNNSQIEIDAAYEGVGSLALIEAKRDLAEDFLVRQLYYPYRVWKNRVTKPVRPIFMMYSNGIYRMREYAFDDLYNYSSLRLIKQMNYSVEDTTISISDIESVLEHTAIVQEPQVSFPQADRFDRVINLCELLSSRELSRTDVTEQYDFDSRQTNYYTDAARYLGLLDKREKDGSTLYSLSEEGRSILNLGYKQRQLAFCRLILSHKVFNDSLKGFLRSGNTPTIDSIVDIMKQEGIRQVKSDSTFVRRASTVRSWITWIVSLINE